MKLNKQPRVAEIIPENHHIWLNLAQAYEAELSNYTNKKPDSHGIYPLDTDITRDNHGYLLLQNTTPIGFCIVKTHDGELNEIGEFYICHHARNNGHGKWFAHYLFDLYKGRWHVKQLQDYTQATEFWRSVIRDYTGNNFAQHTFSDHYWGKVIEQRFEKPNTPDPANEEQLDKAKKRRRLAIPRWQPRKQAQR